MYCAFIDYRKAFDSINRPLPWQKLLSYNINGKLFNVVKNMYDKAKSCVKIYHLYFNYCPCNIGVRQGDNISPLLFALFINDYSHYVGRPYKGVYVSKCCCCLPTPMALASGGADLFACSLPASFSVHQQCNQSGGVCPQIQGLMCGAYVGDELSKCATSEAGTYLFRAANVWWRCAQYFVIVSCG